MQDAVWNAGHGGREGWPHVGSSGWRQHKVLHHISKQWLKHGAVEGYTTGKFFVDTEGVIRPH